jgi:Fic family protein
VANRSLPGEILALLRARSIDAGSLLTAGDITVAVGASRSTVNRALLHLLAGGFIARTGRGPATRYHAVAASGSSEFASAIGVLESRGLRDYLARALASRAPAAYERDFVQGYVPNESSLLPADLAAALRRDGRAPGQQPAGTVARRVLEQLLIDLSWHSSRLEGNRTSLLDTRALFERGRAGVSDPDAIMLLNHKDAIQFLVDAVPEQGITVPVVRNLHALLMQGLLDEPGAPGAIRRRIVSIEGSTYQPLQIPFLLAEMLDVVVAKARLIHNPLEAAFFLWLNVAYLQPFEDGNKRTSRLAANLPLLLHNCAPLSFLDADLDDYARAMFGVYEQLNVALAVELFEATYRRSIAQYRAALTAFGTPDPIRTRYRDELADLVRRVVVGASIADLGSPAGVAAADLAPFIRIVRDELAHLEVYNCARYRLGFPLVERWIAAGRPGSG